jgi:hypothetical protein
MRFSIPSNRRLARDLGTAGVAFVTHAANAIERLLPHTEASGWRIGSRADSSVRWTDSSRRELRFTAELDVGDGFSVSCQVTRLVAPAGVGAIPRTLDLRERTICEAINNRLTQVLIAPPTDDHTWSALQESFDESVIATHLRIYHDLGMAPERLFRSFRSLAEQTYESRAISFGCIIDPERESSVTDASRFPEDYLSRKRFRVLSDGYHTAYEITGDGALSGFVHLEPGRAAASGRAFFPEWSRGLAGLSQDSRIGIALTRHGDLLVLDQGSLLIHVSFWKMAILEPQSLGGSPSQ